MGRLLEIELRLKEIRTTLEGKEQCDLVALEQEMRALQEERSQLMEIEKRNGLAQQIQSGEVEVRHLGGMPAQKEEAEKRGAALKENRSITVGSSTIILPKQASSEIKPGFNVVSSLLDGVTRKPLQGGESYERPYVESYGSEGDYKDTGEAYATTETVFKAASIGKAKITAYSEEPEEVLRLPNADYDSLIRGGISTALRRKISREILIGTSAANRIAGIFSTAATAIDAATDIQINTIDENTLEDITFAYGGVEEVEDDGVLILAKADLRAFAKVRGTQDKKKVYDIVVRGNTGTINNVPFIINSACKAVTDGGTAVGAYCMAYGPLSNYELAVFSDTEITRSTDYKFAQGLIAHKGSTFIGGNVVAKNGFVRVKKKA